MNARIGIKRLFIANRGEIAVRIINACQELGVETVIGVSEADRETLGARWADRAVCIGPAPALHSYLKMEAIVAAAKGTDCDAVHPGYGFLAERASFQRLCTAHGLTFVGPSADAIQAMGEKIRARQIAKELQVPTVPGTDHVEAANDVIEFGHRYGYPFLLKASAGGGGRGMRVVRSQEEAMAAFESASTEARAAFGDPTLYIERYIERARHVEIQVMGDSHGSVVHLGERDCSTQRRHQKLIEEAPSPVVDSDLRARMAGAAILLASHVSYTGAGTVEFIVDLDSKDFYFLEMNTRIQVEHPVTEMLTGVDLVAEQILVAGGAPLSIAQDDVRLNGHSIECRINAESPDQDFTPSPGRIAHWNPPSGKGIRVDTHCYPGYFVPPFYDSMIAKLITHGRSRDAAIAKMLHALNNFEITGIHTTIPFHRAVLGHADFRRNRVTTQWVEGEFMRKSQPCPARQDDR